MRSKTRPTVHRPSTRLPVVTLVPRSVSPVETWIYTLPNGRGGVAIGDAAWAVSHILFLAHRNGWRRVALRFPKARWGGLRSQTVVVSSMADMHLLRAVDMDAVVWRHGLRCRGWENVPAWRWWCRGWPEGWACLS